MNGRLLLLLLIPPALFGFIVFLAVSGQYSLALTETEERYGQATAQQLSLQLVQYVVEDDLLSLNVVASQIAAQDHISSVSVYDDANNLIAQAGKMADDDVSYSSEMSFQDAVVGFVRVGFQAAPVSLQNIMLILIGIFTAYAVALWRFRYLVEGLRQLTSDDEPVREVAPHDPVVEVPDDAPIEHCLLVVRIRSAHHMAKHFDKFFQAARIYHGIVEQTTTEELVIHFEGADAMYLGTCSGRLIQEIAKLAGTNVRFGGAIAMVETNVERQRKAASYLASIADNELLVASGKHLLKDRAELQRFHHSLVDGADMTKVIRLESHDQIERQARELNQNLAVSP